MTNQQKQELKWELVDTLFTKWEYWTEQTGDELSPEEDAYVRKTINSIAKKLGVTNHINLS